MLTPVLCAQGVFTHRFNEKGPPQDIQRIIDRDRLIVSMHKANHEPFFSDEGGKLHGYDVDLAYDIAKKLGVKEVEFLREAENFNSVAKIVADSRADMAISNLSKTLSRSKTVLFSNPYIKLRAGILISRPYASEYKITKENALTELNRENAKFGAEQGSAFLEFTQLTFPKANVVKLASRNEIYQQLIERKVDVVFHEEYLIKLFFNKFPGQAIYYDVIYLDNSDDQIAIAMPGDAYNLKEWVNLYLFFRRENITFDSLYSKYVRNQKDKKKP